MRKTQLISGALLILLFSAFVMRRSSDWKAKDDYIVKFRFGKYTFGVDSMPAPNYGTIKGLKASLLFDENNLAASRIVASVDANSIETGMPAKNASATGPDVLIAEKFPAILFESTSITKAEGRYLANGKLTIKDISKEIAIPFIFQNQAFHGGFTIETADFKFRHPHMPKEISVFFTIPVTQ